MVKNIHITSIDPDNQKVVQEIWIARGSGLYAIKTGNECTLHNISDRTQKTRDFDTGMIKQTSLNDDALTSTVNKIHNSFNIMPFSTPTGIPPDAAWSEITDFNNSAANNNIKLYELRWAEKTYDGSTVQRIWRVSTDASTKLPKNIQWLKQLASAPQPVLDSVMIIEYPAITKYFPKQKLCHFNPRLFGIWRP